MTSAVDDVTSSVLVLDSGYQPHRIVTWYKALSLLISERAEIIAEYDDEIQTVSVTMKVPAVIRLLKAIPHKKRAIRFSRVNVMARDDHRCQYCSTALTVSKATYDHVVPRSRVKSGICPTTWTNIVTCCYPCNNKKKNMTPEEAGMKLLKIPVKPDWLPMPTIRWDPAQHYPLEWRCFLFSNC